MPSIYDVHKKIGIIDPLPVHKHPHELDPPVDVHKLSTWNTHNSLETASRLQWPSGPKAEIRLWYHCNLFETIPLVTHTTSLYRQKISTFYSIQRQNFGSINANFFAWEKDWMTSVGSNFLCGRPHGAYVPFLRPHASTWHWLPPPSVWTSWMNGSFALVDKLTFPTVIITQLKSKWLREALLNHDKPKFSGETLLARALVSNAESISPGWSLHYVVCLVESN